MWGLDPVRRHCCVPVWIRALPLVGPERLMEEAVLVGTRSVTQEGLKAKLPKGARRSVPSAGGDRRTPSWPFWFVWHPHFGQRNESWRTAAVRREMAVPTHVLLRMDHTQGFIRPGAPVKALWLFIVSPVISWGKRQIFTRKQGWPRSGDSVWRDQTSRLGWGLCLAVWWLLPGLGGPCLVQRGSLTTAALKP